MSYRGEVRRHCTGGAGGTETAQEGDGHSNDSTAVACIVLPPQLLTLHLSPRSRLSALIRFGSVEFVAGVMELARVLGDDPRINVEVWHKEK